MRPSANVDRIRFSFNVHYGFNQLNSLLDNLQIFHDLTDPILEECFKIDSILLNGQDGTHTIHREYHSGDWELDTF